MQHIPLGFLATPTMLPIVPSTRCHHRANYADKRFPMIRWDILQGIEKVHRIRGAVPQNALPHHTQI